jgi:hypothetical protein
MAMRRSRVPSAIGNGMPSIRLTGMTERLIYESSNGDVWALARDPASKLPAVMHQPNARSGAQTSYTDIGNFLREGAAGPEHQALLRLIGTLLDDAGRPG